MGGALNAPGIDQIREAQRRIAGEAMVTPLVRYGSDRESPAIFLKLENLQPIGSFKLRGALNRILSLRPEQLSKGVYTASAGNMAQGVAWAARALSVRATVVVPDTAPRAKLDAIARLGAELVLVPYDEWWRTMSEHGRENMPGTFVHPFADQEVMAGNGTIALEIVDDLPDVDTVIVPWGGGGLACGIAAGMKAIAPAVRVYACEVEGAAPFAESLAAGKPMRIQNQRSFIDGIGGPGVFPEMWPIARELLSGSLVVTVDEVADAVRQLARENRVVSEGAGAVALAAAKARVMNVTTQPPRRVACIVSGGNIERSALATILSGSTP